MNLRAAFRLGWFTLEQAVMAADFFGNVAFTRRNNWRQAQAEWLHRASRRHLKIFGCTPEVSGEIPTRGLLVSNHLGYLDILTISAAAPAVFVSMAEVESWPLFGWLAKSAGTIFIRRDQRTHVGAVNREIAAALADGALVVIFPEARSSDGTEVLPFRSSLLEPVLKTGGEISVAHLRYELPDGDARNEVCWWGGSTFFPHLLNLLTKKSIHATLRFEKFYNPAGDRKILARELREAVLRLGETSAGSK